MAKPSESYMVFDEDDFCVRMDTVVAVYANGEKTEVVADLGVGRPFQFQSVVPFKQIVEWVKSAAKAGP